MFCHNCGASMREDSQFCGKCGTPVPHQAPAPVEPPLPDLSSIVQGEGSGVPAAPQIPAVVDAQILGRKKGRGRLPLVAIALVGVLAVGALAVAVVPSILKAANPKLYLAGCAAKTFTTLSAEAEKAEKAVGIFPILEACATDQMEHQFSLGYKEFPSYMAGDASTELLLSASVDVTAQTDIPKRKLSATGGLSFGSMDFLHLNLFADNNILSLNSPELTDRTFYALDTETLGRELEELTGGYSGIDPDLSFNLFELFRTEDGTAALSKESQSELAALTKELTEELTVSKDGTQPVEINGSTEKLPQYTATLPASAVRSYCKSAARVVFRDDALYEALSLYQLTNARSYGYDIDDIRAYTDRLEDELDEALSYLKGDVTFTVSVRKGYLANVLLSCEFMGVDCTAELQIGTANSVLDAISLVLMGENERNNVKIALVSEGNHSGDNGSFTDQTRFTVSENGETYLSLRSDLRLDSKEKLDNFKWTLSMEENYGYPVEVGAKGTVLVDKSGKKLDATLDTLYLETDGERFALKGSYSVAPVQKFDAAPEKVKLLTDMDQEDLYDLVTDLEDRFQDLAYDLW